MNPVLTSREQLVWQVVALLVTIQMLALRALMVWRSSCGGMEDSPLSRERLWCVRT
jgi:hypothetical protein